MVTIVVLVPDALPEVHAGIASLLRQSWRQLEIILIANRAALARVTASDPEILEDDRVVMVDQPDGSDAFELAVSRASGEMIAAHWYGSWAHPQRVEAQATTLMVDPGVDGVVAHHMNVSSNLTPQPLAKTPRADLVGPDRHTAMIRTTGRTPSEILAAHERVLAGYSPVSGALEASEDVAMVGEGAPLTLSLAQPSSSAETTRVRSS